jgi:hypothetical protein
VAALLNVQLKFYKKALTAARLQHLLKEPRDGLTPPRVIFYKTRFAAALNRLLGCACIFSAGLCNLNYRMTAPEKITALGEAPGFKADYHQLCLFYYPKPKSLNIWPLPDAKFLGGADARPFFSSCCTNPNFDDICNLPGFQIRQET